MLIWVLFVDLSCRLSLHVVYCSGSYWIRCRTVVENNSNLYPAEISSLALLAIPSKVIESHEDALLILSTLPLHADEREVYMLGGEDPSAGEDDL